VGRRRRSDDEEPGITMTPLIDVVLLLLIFYVVTTAFVDRELNLQLPESEASAIAEERRKFTIELAHDGRVALNGSLTTLPQLDATIEREAAADNIKAVEIRADKLVVHGRVVEVLGIVKKHGVDNVGIAVKHKS
jgi:biopolymer transport protein ExbD